MGLFSKINQLWSKSDFWDKKENAQQAQAFKEEEERKRREQQILAQQRAEAQAKLNAQRQQPKTIGGADFNLGGINNPNSTPPPAPKPTLVTKPQPAQEQAPQGPLDFVSRTRPQTVNLDMVKKPAVTPKITVGPDQQRIMEQGNARAEERLKRDVEMLQTTPYKDNRNIFQRNIPILSSAQDVEVFNGFDSPNRMAHDVAVAKSSGLTLPELALATPEERAEIENQVRKMKNLSDVSFGADVALSLTPFRGASVAARNAASSAAKMTIQQIVNAIRRRVTDGIVQRAAIGAGVATGLDAGGQAYVTGEVDPSSLPLSAAQGALFGATDPFDMFDSNRTNVNVDSRRSRIRGLDIDVEKPRASATPDVDGQPTIDVIDVGPRRPQVDEVAPGVIKSPTATPPAQAIETPPITVQPPVSPVPEPSTPPPFISQPGTSPAIPTGQRYEVPQLPQSINPEIQKAVADAQAQAQQAALAPTVTPDVPVTERIITPTQAKSEAAPVVAAPGDVVTRQLTPAEMAEMGMSPEQIEAVMARRANPDAPKPEPTPDPEAVARAEEVARAEAQAAADAGENPRAPKDLEFNEKGEVTSINGKAVKEKTATERLLEEPVDLERRVETGRKALAIKQQTLNELDEQGVAHNSKQYRRAKRDLERSQRSVPRWEAEAEAAKKSAKTVAPEKTDVAQSDATPVKPAAPTKSDLQKGARENVTKAGTVSKRWVEDQFKAGAKPADIRSAVEKVEGRKVPDTAEQKLTKAQRAKANAIAKAEAEKAKAEGRTKEAAPEFTKSQARKVVKDTEAQALQAATARSFKAYVRKVNIEAETKAAADEVAKYSTPTKLKSYTEDLLTNSEGIDDPSFMFKATAVMQKLDEMLVNKKIDYDDMMDLAAKVAQGQAVRASQSGQVQRIVRELYGRVPAPVRVEKELNRLSEHFKQLGKDFEPSKADKTELIAHTREFDKAIVDLKGVEANIEATMSRVLEPNTDMSKAELSAARREFTELTAQRKAAQEAAVKANQAYSDKIASIKPPLTRADRLRQFALSSPDVAGNYLRMSMLSAPSGRIRDVFSTAFNVADQTVTRLGEVLIGKALNKTVGTHLIDTMGTGASLKKGARGAIDKLKSSWRGEPTLDEATGRGTPTDRSELKSFDSISAFGGSKPTVSRNLARKIGGLPKKAIRTAVQAPTDATYGVYTSRLSALGLQQAKKAGLTGDRAKLYSEMFMEQPDAASVKDAARIWLENSGMHDNFVSRTLTKLTDALDKAGSNPKESTKSRFVKKAAARVFRTTTIPFAQYMGGATHAMLVKQNPVINLSNAAIAGFKKNPQRAVEELARGGWNTAKITTLMGLMASGSLEISDTDADGESAYNGPYVVTEDGRYIPASSYGIAAGSAIISGHYLNKAKQDFADGNIAGAIANSTVGPWWATIKASGLDNTLSGSNVLGGLPASVSQVANNPNKDASDVAATIGGGMIGDVGTQSTPAVLRDIDAFLNQNPNYNPTGEAPDTSGKDPVTGKVDPIRKGVAQVKAGIPFLSDDLPRKSGYKAKSFKDRIFNANTQTEQQAAKIRDKAADKKATAERAASVFGDENITKLMTEEGRAIFDKYKGDASKASEEEQKKIWTAVKDGKDRLLDDGKFESYSKVLRMEREDMVADGKSTETELAKFDRKITRSDLAGKNKVDPQLYRLYTGDDTAEGGGISQEELNAMFDPDKPEVYDPETANALLALDKLFAENGVSSGSKGVNPWTRPKYTEPKDGWGGSKKGGKGKQIATDFGTIGSAGSPDGPSQKYKSLDAKVPNVTSQVAKTNLKKKISVVKGVRL